MNNKVKSTHKKLKLGGLSSGHSIYIDTYHIRSENKGLKVYIQAGIHGPEIAGIPLVWKLKDFLSKNLIAGEVLLVPCANPWGLDTKIGNYQIGYINHNGDKFGNWNRIFINLLKKPGASLKKFCSINKGKNEELVIKKFEEFLKNKLNAIKSRREKEYGLNKELVLSFNLQQPSCNADILIDLHTSGHCIKHLYYFKHQQDYVRGFGISDMILLPYEFHGVLDESLVYPWKKLKDKGLISSIPKEAYTIELYGNSYSSTQNVDKDMMNIVNFLHTKGVCKNIEGKKILSTKFFVCKMQEVKHLYSPIGGIFHTNIDPGDFARKGSVIGEVLQKDSKKNIRAPWNGKALKVSTNHSVETGQLLFSMATNIKRI